MRKLLVGATFAVFVALLAALLVVTASADSVGTDFESFTLGSVNQDGWSVTGPYDQEVVSNTYGYGDFDTKAFRISNAVTTGSFGDQTFTNSLGDEAGETSATNNGKSGGTRQQHFDAQFEIASTMSAQQPNLAISVSPDRGDGSRQSYLRFEDGTGGIDVFFDDVQGVTAGVANFVETQLAVGLPRSAPHTIRFSIDFYDGPSNDVVRISIDGNLVHIGTTWEDYYRYDTEASAEQTTRTVDSLIIRSAGTAEPLNSGNGFLFDNFQLSSGPIAVPVASTYLVTGSNLSTTGFDNSLWFFYNDGSGVDGVETHLPDNSLGSFVLGPPPAPLGFGSAQISVFNDARRNLATYQFSGTPLGDITTLKFSTYNPSAGNGGPSTTRSAYLNFNVDFTGTSGTWQHRLAFVPSQNGTVVQNAWQEWDAIAGGNAQYAFSGTYWPTPTTGPDAGATNVPGSVLRTWNQLLADYPGIRILPIGSDAGWLGLRVGEPYASGYTENMDKFVFGTASTLKTWDFDPTLKVHILKYLDGSEATAASANNFLFPMTACWSAQNLGSGCGSYVLGNHFNGAAAQYGADTGFMTPPANYTTSETTNASGPVVPVGAVCSAGDYRLLGYSTSESSFADAETQPLSSTPPNFVGIGSDRYVIVWNETCPTCTDHKGPKVSVYSVTATQAVLKVKDNSGGSGIQSIEVIVASNVTVSIPAFTPGETGQILVTATKINPNSSAVIGLKVTDVCGNVTTFDPAQVTVDPGRHQAVQLTGILDDESLVQIVNDNLDGLRLWVNGHVIDVKRLRRHETRNLDIGWALHDGDDNTIVVQGRGPVGASAEVTVYPPPALGPVTQTAPKGVHARVRHGSSRIHRRHGHKHFAFVNR